jgi:hypothetical protein
LEDAHPGGIRQHFFTAALLLLCLEAGIGFGRLLLGVMDRAIRLGADLANLPFVDTVGDDGLGGVLAGLEF